MLSIKFVSHPPPPGAGDGWASGAPQDGLERLGWDQVAEDRGQVGVRGGSWLGRAVAGVDGRQRGGIRESLGHLRLVHLFRFVHYRSHVCLDTLYSSL